MVGVRPECGSARKGKKQERDVEARDRIFLPLTLGTGQVAPLAAAWG